MDRPAGSNADEWCLFLSEHSPEYAAVQIAEAIEQAEREACERAIDRMGWDEIGAYNREMRKGQSVFEDAGGYLMRGLACLFGVKPKDEVVSYQDAARAMLKVKDTPP